MKTLRLLVPLAATLFAAACADSPLPPPVPNEPARDFTASSSYSVSLGTSASYVYDDFVYLEASPSPAGSYYYAWEVMWCFNGWEPSDCDYTWRSFGAGQNLTGRSKWIGRGECWSQFIVRMYAYQGGPLLAEDWAFVSGAGEWVGPWWEPAPGCF